MPGRREPSHQPTFGLEDVGARADAPLASRMRPRTISEFVGQAEVVGPGALLRTAIERRTIPSIILWGPPGCGKTTLARILAGHADAIFVAISAVSSGVADLRRLVGEAKEARAVGQRTVLFIDEIHRFNKAQQDVILPYVEDGTFTLIGATTENPSFEVVAPLLSRVRVVRMLTLDEAAIDEIIENALADPDRGLGGKGFVLEPAARSLLIKGAAGDGRAALTALELAARASDGPITVEHAKQALQDRRPYHDRQGDFHYDTISAFIKSVRGSDPDAALYWLARMIEAGEDPLFIVRRMVILAAEDVGLADPQALSVAVACQQAVHFIGMPEGFLPMAEACLYLALAPKSNSALESYVRAMEDAKETSHQPVPLHLRNASTGLMHQMGYGKAYRYAHAEPEHYARDENYLPEELKGRQYYSPGGVGREAELAARLKQLRGEELPGGD